MESAQKKELPKFLALKSKCNGKYLRCTTEEGSTYGFLRFSDDYVVSPYTKFEVEPAKIGKGLVHLRCCYNNKYWVRVSLPASGSDLPEFYIIAATAKEPEEDQSKELCTLFKPVYDNNNADDGFRFLHVQQGFYLSSSPGTSTANHYAILGLDTCPNHLFVDLSSDQSSLSSPAAAEEAGFTDCLYAGISGGEGPGGGDAHNIIDVFEIVDWDSILILPKYVAFKNYNGKYLIPRENHFRRHRQLEFAGSDKGEATVGNEIFPTPDGNIRIRNISLDKFWRLGYDGEMWICPHTSATHYKSSSVVFSPVKVENNVIAIRSLDNNKFCMRGKKDRLSAKAPTISKEAQIVVEDFVVSREIYDVKYRLSDAMIHSQKVLTMSSGVARNGTQETNCVELKLRYVDSKSSTWKCSTSLKLGVKTNIQTMPFIGQSGSVEISAEKSVDKEWGETVSETTEVEKLYRFKVPRMSQVTVSLLVSVGSCNVPFSYTQRDVLYNGRPVTANYDDGVYIGINHYNVQFETKQEELVLKSI